MMAASDCSADRLSVILFVAFGGWTALFGVFANALLASLFIVRFNYRHSPFFFMGFVAFFDSLVDLMYILNMAFPVTARFLLWSDAYFFWILNSQRLLLIVQIFKIASVFCLIIASYERYSLTKHWTNSGFDYSVRWIVLIGAILLSVIIKVSNPTKYEIVERAECEEFLFVERAPSTDGIRSLLDMLTVTLPFLTLIFLNGGIVLMIRKQNVQQLRSLITQLTLGRDLMEVRRQNLRSATNTLLFIITVYLISNFLALTLTFVEYWYPGYYETNYPEACRFFNDLSNLLTVVGNALRPPAHLFSNAEIRAELCVFICGHIKMVKKPPKLKGLDTLHQAQWENPWFSALLTTARDRVGSKQLDVVLTEECREPLFRHRSMSGSNPIFDRDVFRRLSNVGYIMYNGVGVQTARGTGTSGYVQANVSALSFSRHKKVYNAEPDIARAEAEVNRKPNAELLDHEYKRRIEIRCAELEDLMEAEGSSAAEIEERVSEYRKLLFSEFESGRMDLDNELDLRNTHSRRKVAADNKDRFRRALKINSDFVDGTSMVGMKKAGDQAAESLNSAESENPEEELKRKLIEKLKEERAKKKSRKRSASTSSSSSSSSSSSEEEKKRKRKSSKKKHHKKRRHHSSSDEGSSSEDESKRRHKKKSKKSKHSHSRDKRRLAKDVKNEPED